MSRRKMQKVGRFFVCAMIILFSLVFLEKLLEPKYQSHVTEGNMIASYYTEPKDHDVIFIGDCELYENISPQILWDRYGLNSFIRGSAQQLIWQSYYLLEDTLRYEKPKVVVFNVLSMKYDKPQNEAYNRMTLDGMRWSLAKVRAIRASMMEDENFIEYVFPLLRYHSRWQELTKEDVKYMFTRGAVTHNGYYMRCDTQGIDPTLVPVGKPLGNYRFSEIDYEYLDRMKELCRKEQIQLVLMKAPSLYPYWYDEWEEQIKEYAALNGLCYISYEECLTKTDLDFSTDTYDQGLHLNLSGAEKLTAYVGKRLQDECGLPNRKSEELLNERWKEKRKEYERDRDRQLERIRKQG